MQMIPHKCIQELIIWLPACTTTTGKFVFFHLVIVAVLHVMSECKIKPNCWQGKLAKGILFKQFNLHTQSYTIIIY